MVSDQLTSSTKALALGALIDPSFDWPLPLGGLDVLDFNFLNRDMQLALLFAGVFAAGNVQRANLWGGRFDASVDFAVSRGQSNDCLFDAQGEETGQQVDRVPVSTGVNLGFRSVGDLKLSLTTSSNATSLQKRENGAGLYAAREYGTHGRRGGLRISARRLFDCRQRDGASPHERGGVRPPTNIEQPPTTRSPPQISALKDFIFATFHTVHLNGAYFGGNQLDRFSMYQFGFFDAARMHGVPSAVRFGELAMFRGSYSFNLFNQYRVDLFVDHARGRDATRDECLAAGSWIRTGNRSERRCYVLRVDLGKSLLPDAYRGAGSTVVQIMLLKPL